MTESKNIKSDVCVFISVLLLLFYCFIIRYRHLMYFYPDKILKSTPDDFNMNYIDMNIKQINGWLIKNKKSKFSDKLNQTKLLIYSHGNAGNISHRIPIIQKLLTIFTDADIFIYDYPQFGLSNKTLNLNTVVLSAYDVYAYWTNTNKYKDIGLIGESIGAGVNAELYDLLIRYKLSAPYIIIHLNGISSLRSVVGNILGPYISELFIGWINEFDCEKIYLKHVLKLPKLLVIHANRDQLIKFNSIKQMIHNLKICTNVYFVQIIGSHNDPIITEKATKKIKYIYKIK